MKKPMEYLSIGMIENFPLTDKPVCTFNSDCIIYGYKDTEAERYANEWNLEFVTLESVTGDLNFDGEFNISNVVTLQKYLVKRKDLQMNSGNSPTLTTTDSQCFRCDNS